MSRYLKLLLILLLATLPTQAQDALNLPTALYILQNDGYVERYGLGAAGVVPVTPDGEYVLDFGIAPDNNWIAYRTQAGLFISNIWEPDQVALIDEMADVPAIRGEGETLIWSADGTVVAYATLSGVRVYFRPGNFFDIAVGDIQNLDWSPTGQYLLAESKDHIWWVYQKDGTTMNLVSVVPPSNGVTWLNETTLMFAPVEGGLLAMNLADGNAQTTLLNPQQVYSFPYRIAEGTFRVFAKSPPEEGLGILTLVQISNGQIITEEIGSADVVVNDVRWAPRGELLIAFQGNALALVDPMSGAGFTLPITSAVSYGWGAVQSNLVDRVAVDGRIYFLGSDIVGVRQVWLVEGEGLPRSVTPSETDITAYDISPDGQSIAYVTDTQLWHFDTATDELTSLVESPAAMRAPRFSRDGQRIAYEVDTTEDHANGGIWLVDIAGEENTLILKNGAGNGDGEMSPPFYHKPRWAPNINALLVNAEGSETHSLSIVDVNTLEVLPVGQYDDGFWLNSGQVIAWGTGTMTGDPQASEIVVLDPNTQADPISLFALPENVIVERVIEVARNELRLLTRSATFGPSPLTIVRVPINGSAERLLDMKALVDPVFSPDAETIAGLTHQAGNLAIYEPSAESLQILTFPSLVSDVMWR